MTSNVDHLPQESQWTHRELIRKDTRRSNTEQQLQTMVDSFSNQRFNSIKFMMREDTSEHAMEILSQLDIKNHVTCYLLVAN